MRAIAVREDIKDLILDAADHLLSECGYQGMTMDMLALKVGIGKGTLYLHYPSKEEIVLSHVDRIVYRLLVKLQTIAHGGDTVEVKLREMLLTRVLYRFNSVQHYTESLSDLLAAVRPKLLARREKHFALEAKVFTQVLEEGRHENLLLVKDLPVVAHTFLIVTNSLLPYSLSSSELGKRKDIEKKVARIADLMLLGLFKRD